jgi:hypothetical protein
MPPSRNPKRGRKQKQRRKRELEAQKVPLVIKAFLGPDASHCGAALYASMEQNHHTESPIVIMPNAIDLSTTRLEVALVKARKELEGAVVFMRGFDLTHALFNLIDIVYCCQTKLNQTTQAAELEVELMDGGASRNFPPTPEGQTVREASWVHYQGVSSAMSAGVFRRGEAAPTEATLTESLVSCRDTLARGASGPVEEQLSGLTITEEEDEEDSVLV